MPGAHARNTRQFAQTHFARWIGFAAVVLATINVVGGYAITDRMLAMFKKKEKP